MTDNVRFWEGGLEAASIPSTNTEVMRLATNCFLLTATRPDGTTCTISAKSKAPIVLEVVPEKVKPEVCKV